MSPRWTPRLSREIIAARKAAGEWRDVTLADRLNRLVGERPGQVLFIDGETKLTAAQTRDTALRLAAGMQARGLKPGDVVSVQLPIWVEAALIEIACAYGGFVCNPIVQIYRDAEVRHIVSDAEAKLFFIPETFRHFDYSAMVGRIEACWEGRTETVIVRPESPGRRPDFKSLLTASSAAFRPHRVDPDAIKLLLYTSGTTGPAKGVLHSHNTIAAEIDNFTGYIGLDASDVLLMSSSLGHITGYLYGIQLPVTLGCPVVLIDNWDAGLACDLIERHRISFSIGATPFLQELTDVAKATGRRLPSLRRYGCGGAPVPSGVIVRANAAFENCAAFRVYGSTEAPTITLGVPDRTRESLAATTEGYIVGHEVRLTAPDGALVTTGEEGEIRTRGPEVCLGYADPTHNEGAFDTEGFFRTGDLARMTPEGCLVITGRAKDLIIRGGENLSPKEVEDILHSHPSVAVAAVVAMPHPRLGETGCAVVTLKPGAHFDFAAMTELLGATGLARQKWPERLQIVETMPYTAAGKIRKNVLRDEIRALVEAESAKDAQNG